MISAKVTDNDGVEYDVDNAYDTRKEVITKAAQDTGYFCNRYNYNRERTLSFFIPAAKVKKVEFNVHT